MHNLRGLLSCCGNCLNSIIGISGFLSVRCQLGFQVILLVINVQEEVLEIVSISVKIENNSECTNPLCDRQSPFETECQQDDKEQHNIPYFNQCFLPCITLCRDSIRLVLKNLLESEEIAEGVIGQ